MWHTKILIVIETFDIFLITHNHCFYTEINLSILYVSAFHGVIVGLANSGSNMTHHCCFLIPFIIFLEVVAMVLVQQKHQQQHNTFPSPVAIVLVQQKQQQQHNTFPSSVCVVSVGCSVRQGVTETVINRISIFQFIVDIMQFYYFMWTVFLCRLMPLSCFSYRMLYSSWWRVIITVVW